MEVSDPYLVYNVEALGLAVKHFREQAGMTQAELAQKMGIRQQYLSEIETGKMTEQTQRLVGMFKLLGVMIFIGRSD